MPTNPVSVVVDVVVAAAVVNSQVGLSPDKCTWIRADAWMDMRYETRHIIICTSGNLPNTLGINREQSKKRFLEHAN